MTRDEFIEIDTYDELYDADYDLGTNEFDKRNIQSNVCVADILDDTIRNWRDSWWKLRDYLDSIDENYNWYIFYDYDYHPHGLCNGDSTFEDIKDEILRMADDDGLFDDDYKSDDECLQESREIHVVIEDFSMSDFL